MVAVAAGRIATVAKGLSRLLDDKNASIKNTPAVFLIITALIFDLAQFLTALLLAVPYFGIILGTAIPFVLMIIGYTLIITITKVFFRGVQVFGGKGAWTRIATMMIELVPGIAALPGMTVFTGVLVLSTRLKDLDKAQGGTLGKFISRGERERKNLRVQHRQSETEAKKEGGTASRDDKRRENKQALTAFDEKTKRQNFGMAVRTVAGRTDQRRLAPYSQSNKKPGLPEPTPPPNDNDEVDPYREYLNKDAT